MKIIKLNPSTPGQRHQQVIQKNLLGTQNKLVKALTFSVKRCVGRSSKTGHITIKSRGAGCKKLYRNVVSGFRNMLGLLLFSVYDPNRTAFVSLVFDFLKKQFVFVLNTSNTPAGSVLTCSQKFIDVCLGFRTCLAAIPSGSAFHSLNLNQLYKAQYARAAGTYCVLLEKSKTKGTVRLPSGQIIFLSTEMLGTLGIVSNERHRFTVLGKAGRNRLKGFRPHVRGIAMNPVDHPHGGRTNGGRPSVTPWAKPAHGRKTSNSKINKLYKL